MKIDRQNYEAYFLDYVEGKLNAEETARLMDFLDHNPDLKAELENFESLTLVPELNIFTEKDLLKKSIENYPSFYESNFVELCIARVEGDMDNSGKNLFESYLQQHPEKLKEYKQYLKTILEPDKKIVFKEKRKLKHYEVNYQRNKIYHIIAAAASIVLLIFAYKFNFGYRGVENNQISHAVKIESKVVVVNNKFNSKVIEHNRNSDKKILVYQPLKIENTVISQTHKQVKKQEILMQMKSRMELNQLETPALQEKPLISECKINAGVEVNGVKTATNENKYLTLAELAENEINKTIKNQNLPIEKGINLWTLAKSGIIGINKVFGSKIILNNTKDTTTNRTRFELDTGLLGYYSSSEKK